MKSHLRIKFDSLSSEMTMIRKRELKWKEKARAARQKQKTQAETYCMDNFWSLRWHRKDLKQEIRTTHLALGALRGTPYSKMEYISYGYMPGYNRSGPDWVGIQNTIERFVKDEPSRAEIMQRFSEWLHDAKKWYLGNEDRIPQYWNELDAAREARAADIAYQAFRKDKAQKARENAFSRIKAA